MKRWWRYRVIVPLKRSPHPPDYTARGVSVGLFWALTPTVGVQMALVLAHWLVVRRLGRWDFNVVHAMAWTWVTNFFTIFPVYYTFYVSGQVLLGRWYDLTGYHGFLRLWDSAFGVGEGGVHLVGGIESYAVYFNVIIEGWGLAMLVGCLPYAVAGAWIGYAWSLRLVVNHRRARLQRRIRRAQSHLSEGAQTNARGRDGRPGKPVDFGACSD